ncbi:MFS transporter [Salibacterium salarium]|uniref:MFS transporter n=1 Tax=Salibacterium salarium TaxID=284579 RepID=A0A3R9NZ41_9BACI|nr:MFS transporter [Salibacterium salarium]RSL29302.1 MFS transporter [Salibacterium salarium]
MNNQFRRFKWVVFVAVLFTYLLMSSQRTAPGLITEQIMLDFNITATTVGLLISIQFFVYTALQIPMGILADRYGPNFFLISGAILTGIGTIIYSLSSHEFVLFFARVLTGVGDATIWVNMVLILGQMFNTKEFTRLIGVAAMMGNLGYLLATIPFSLVIGILGWRPAFFSAGVLLCLCGIFLYIVLLRITKQPVFKKNEIQHEKIRVLLRRIFSKRQAWALFFCHFGIVGTYVGFISSWGVPYGMNVYGMTRAAASQLIMLGLIGALIGAPLASWISSRLKTIKKPYVVVHIILLLTWSVFLIFNGNPPFRLLTILFFIIGLAYGANALTFATVRLSFSIKDVGIISGFANTGGFLSAILLPSIFGKVLDHFQVVSGSLSEGYYYGFITPVIFSIVGLIGVISINEKRQVRDKKK